MLISGQRLKGEISEINTNHLPGANTLIFIIHTSDKGINGFSLNLTTAFVFLIFSVICHQSSCQNNFPPRALDMYLSSDIAV